MWRHELSGAGRARMAEPDGVMSLEALRAELAAASAQVIEAASTAVDPWDVVSGEEDNTDDDDEEEEEENEEENEAVALNLADGSPPSPHDEQSLDDATPRSIYDEAEQTSVMMAGDGIDGGSSDPSGSADPHTSPQAYAAAAGDPWAGLAAATAPAADLDVSLPLAPPPVITGGVLPVAEPQLVPLGSAPQPAPASAPKKKKKRTCATQ